MSLRGTKQSPTKLMGLLRYARNDK